MRNNDEKRNARRIRLQPAVAGSLSHFPVSIVDLSSSGARVQHDAPLTFQPGKRFILDFSCEGEHFRLPCTVARSRMEMNPSHRTIYTTGIRFADLEESMIDCLWGIMGFLAVDVLAHEPMTSDASDFELLTH
jgi:PilZ domain-containing protein